MYLKLRWTLICCSQRMNSADFLKMERLSDLLKVRSTIPVLVVLLSAGLYCQDWEIIPLSKKVGVVLDAEENQFYSVYPDIKGFESAQYYQLDENTISVRIVFINRGITKTSNRKMSLKSFIALQNTINSMKEITEKDREILRSDLLYLQIDRILSTIPAGRYVIISRITGWKVRGTLSSYDSKDLVLNTMLRKKSVPITDLETISIRQEVKARPKLKWVVPAVLGAVGFTFAGIIVSEKDIGTDRETYTRFAGATLALAATGTVIEAIQAFLTPMETYDLETK